MQAVLRKTSSRSLAAFAIVAMVSLLTACGGSSHNSSSSQSSSASASGNSGASSSTSASSAPKTSSAKGTPFVLGSVCSCTGVQSSVLGDSGDVAHAWANYVNATGGINGHPVKLIVKDDGQNPATALQNVKQLVQNDHVQAIVGDSSEADQTFESYLVAKGIPVIGGNTSSTPFSTSPDWFPSGANQAGYLFGTFDQAKGHAHLGMMYCAETPVCAQLVPPAADIGKVVGYKLTAEKVSATSPNYTAPCLKLKSAGDDVLYIADNGAIVEHILADCAQQGYKPVNVGQGPPTSNPFLKSPVAQGFLAANMSANPYDASTPAVKTFQDAVNKSYPGLLKADSFSYLAIMPWTAGQLFNAAAKAGKLTPSSTPAQVTAAMYELPKGDTLGGLAPPLTFTKGKPTSIWCWFTSKVANKTLVSTNGDKPTCLSKTQIAAVEKAYAS